MPTLICFQSTTTHANDNYKIKNESYFEPQLPKPKTAEEIQQEKAEILRLLDRLQAKGVRLDKKYTMELNYEEMKGLI